MCRKLNVHEVRMLCCINYQWEQECTFACRALYMSVLVNFSGALLWLLLWLPSACSTDPWQLCEVEGCSFRDAFQVLVLGMADPDFAYRRQEPCCRNGSSSW